METLIVIYFIPMFICLSLSLSLDCGRRSKYFQTDNKWILVFMSVVPILNLLTLANLICDRCFE